MRRLAAALKRWPAAWQSLYLIVLLIIGAYVIFDILDVDASQMTDPPAEAIIVPQAPQVEAIRFFRVDLLTPESTRLTTLSLFQQSSIRHQGLSPASVLLRLHLGHIFARVNLHREMASASSTPTDPA